MSFGRQVDAHVTSPIIHNDDPPGLRCRLPGILRDRKPGYISKWGLNKSVMKPSGMILRTDSESAMHVHDDVVQEYIKAFHAELRCVTMAER